MSRAFPLQVKPAGRRGPRPKPGGRYPGGKLKPSGPNPRLIEIRRAIAADVSLAENPLDAAFANGWLAEAERRAGKAYALIAARAEIGAPRAGRSALPERSGGEEAGAGVGLGGLPGAELAALWDLAFGETAPAAPAVREAEAARAMRTWRAIGAALRPAARAELTSVCVLEEWPPWLVRRLEARAMRAQAAAEKRALSDAELAAVARRFSGADERRREHLIEALTAVAAVLRPPPRPSAPQTVPIRAPPIRAAVVESVDYVTAEGAHVFSLERRGGRGG